jgi:hypothetical protein
VKRAVATLITLLVLFAGVTYAALELGGVARVETQQADGSLRETHVWFVKNQRELWLEAGSPDNGWFVDVQRTGELDLAIDGRPFRYQTEISRKPADRKRVRTLLRQKYGWRDWWVGMFVDQESATPVLLVPVKPAPIPHGKRGL